MKPDQSITYMKDKGRITIEGPEEFITWISLNMHKLITYKLTYIYNITYEEALSIFKSNSKQKMLNIYKQKLTTNERKRT